MSQSEKSGNKESVKRVWQPRLRSQQGSSVWRMGSGGLVQLSRAESVLSECVERRHRSSSCAQVSLPA